MATKIASLLVEIGADIKQLKKGFAQAKTAGKTFSNQLGDIAAAAGLAFGIHESVQLTKQMVVMAGQAQGVAAAFKEIGDNAALEELRKSTKGTVSDLELMQQAVQAKNFGIPLQQMGELLEFARRRAKATGKSVEYLTNSIVLGLGRKSIKILDNLQISVEQLKQELGGISPEAASVEQVTAAVGRIASRVNDATVDVNTFGETLQQISATLDNLKVTLGSAINKELSAFVKRMSEAGGAMKTMVQESRVLAGTLLVIGNVIKTSLLLPFKVLQILVQGIIETFQFLGKAITLFEQEGISAFTKLPDIAKQGFANIADIAIEFGKETAEGFLEAYNVFMNGWPEQAKGHGWKGGQTTGRAYIEGFKSMQPMISEASSLIGDETVRSLQDSMDVDDWSFILNDWAGDFNEALKGAFTGLAESVENVVASIFDFDPNTSGLDATLSAVGSFMGTLGKSLIALGVADAAFLTAFDPGSKIAAGIALVALSGVVKGIMSRGPAGGGGASSGGAPKASGGVTFQERPPQPPDVIIEGDKLRVVYGNSGERRGRRG